MKNYRNHVVEKHYSATKEVMVCSLLVQMVADKKIFHGRPPPPSYICNLQMKAFIK